MNISIVVPCYNEEKNIRPSADGLKEVLTKIGKSWEVIFVDDGSKDATWEEITQVCRENKQVCFSQNKGFKGVRHMRNYGQTAAYQAGFDASKGDFVITFSSDNETPAEEIEKVIGKLEEGYDMVNTNREERYKEDAGKSFFKRIPSILANRVINKMSGLQVKDTGSGVKGFRRVLVQNMHLYGDMHRFLPAYCSMFGAKICEVDVAFNPRIYGESAYGKVGLSRTFKVFLDIIALKFLLSFSTKPFTMMPIRIFGGTGIISMILGGFLGSILAFDKIVLGQNIGTRPLLFLSVLLIILGFQFISLGLLGELMLRIYFESQGKRTYIVREEVA
ncbi:glycosyltransferase family 2 protein [Candidatus Parcubacteria bacterium]|nr:glycosyltransferase family 2 protein [Patescibacteria group bacterium]MCG2689484.1 glycosyltransferase family 2 protein [Candidatus Parcubacteria bacterium]